jgi:ankyrin repeat protein
MILDSCEEGHITKLRLWTLLGVNVQFSDRPLIRALADGQVGVVRYLVEELGADVNQTMARGLTPFIIAAGKGDVGLLRYLKEELGANVNHAMENGTTALMFAAQSGNVCALRYLGKELGADVNQARLDDGNTFLLISAILGSLDVVQCLVKELGADVNLANGNCLTPLMGGAFKGNLGLVRWLLNAEGASVDEEDPRGQTLWRTLKLEDADDIRS